MNTQKLLSYTRKAIDDYGLIREGDHIAVGISGGKDSLTLLTALYELQRFYPAHFTLEAITVDLGNSGFVTAPLEAFCRERDIRIHVWGHRLRRLCLRSERKRIPALSVRRCEKEP